MGIRAMADIYELNKEKTTKQKESFAKQEVDLSETPLFFPEGFENIFLGIYFIFLPYIAGLLFQFFYIAKMQMDIFIILNNSILLTWCIGYEIIAFIILVLIAKEAITYSRPDNGFERFQRP